MYPAIIILLVSNLISQQDILYGSHSKQNESYIAPHREGLQRRITYDHRITFAARSAPDLSLRSREDLSMELVLPQEGRVVTCKVKHADSIA